MTIGKPLGEAAAEKAATRSVSNPKWKRRSAAVSRWLHIYLSMVSFGIVLFFSVTGLTLNHMDWFGQKELIVRVKGKTDLQWVKPETVGKLEVVEFLRNKHGIRGALSDFRVDPAQCAISFKGPGYTADAFVDRNTGEYELTEVRMGWVAIVNDLHKGRDTGKVWSGIIDASAILMILVSISGLVLILFLQKRLRSGLISLVLGCAVCYALYALFVP